MKLALQLLTWNSARYLPYLLDSLKRQTFRDWQLFVLDSGSSPEEWALTEAAVIASGLPVFVDHLHKNTGFAPGHDLMFGMHQAEYVQLLNPDAILEPDYLERVLAYLETHPHCAAASGRILRWNFDRRDDADGGRTAIVDSLGLDVDWKLRITDRGAGQPLGDAAGQTAPEPVFGVSGCLPMYRRCAVREAGQFGGLFDGTFGSYKEDCDLALRLDAAGFRAATVHAAVAYHRRSYGVGTAKPSPAAQYLSYRNQLWLLLTHFRLVKAKRAMGIAAASAGPAKHQDPNRQFDRFRKIWDWFSEQPDLVRKILAETIRLWPHLMAKREFVRRLRLSVPHERLTPDEAEADVAVVIVSYDCLEEECLKSLAEAQRQSRRRIAVVVVDNGSTKYDAHEFVGRHIKDAVVILRNGNFGFGRSCNRGAQEVSAKYYFFLNPDTLIADPTVFDRMYDYLEAHREIGLAAPRLVDFHGGMQETCRRYPAWYMPLTQRTSVGRTGWGQLYTEKFLMRDYDHAAPRSVDWVQGSAMMVPHGVWHRVGGFDDRYWMYYEDVDLCRRVRLAGLEVAYCPEFSIAHRHQRESARIHNAVINLAKSRATRGHVASWFKYHLKWALHPVPSADIKD